MQTFAANLTMLFTEVPFMERFKLAKENGFEFIEYLFPYAYDKYAIRKQLDQYKLTQVLFNLPPGNWDAGERGIACLPDRVLEFHLGVNEALEYAKALNVSQLNCLSGLRSNNFDDQEQWATLVSNVKYAAQRLGDEDITLMVEPINSRVDMPGFFIDTLDKTNRLLDEVDEANVKIQFDIYHMQIMHGDLCRHLQHNLARIGHIQFADNPGRHEPGSGEINFTTLFSHLNQLEYSGYVSAEYHPSDDTISSLNWLRKQA